MEKKQKYVSRQHGFFYELKRHKGMFLLLLPGFIYLLINNYLPMIGMIIAFKRINRLGGNILDTYIHSPWVGFKNFNFFFKTKDAWIITRNTVLYNLTFIIMGIILAVLVAIVLNEIKSKVLVKFYQTSIMLPGFLSWVVISGIGYAFLTNNGLINTALKAMGHDTVNFYSEPAYWPFILTSIQLWYNLGVGSVMYLAALTSVSPDFYEAAAIDGASKWQQIKNISIPFLKPTIITMALISLGGIFSANFGLFYNIPRESGVLFNVTNVIDTYVYRALRTTGMPEMATAASVYQSVVGFVVVVLSNRLIKKVSPDNAMF